MRKILDINANPALHGYSHTADFMSIVTNKVRFGLSDINVSDFKWQYETIEKQDFDTVIETAGEKKKVTILPSGIKKNNEEYDISFGIKKDEFISSFFFNSVDGLNSFEFKLNAMKEVCRWSIAGAEISSGEFNAPEKVFRAVFSPMNVIRISGNEHGDDYSYEVKNEDECKYMRIVVSKSIEVFVSKDGCEWKSIHIQNNIFDASARIGFFAWIGEDRFKDWYYSNFIQLHCSKDLTEYYDVKLNYYLPAFLNYRHNMSNPWLEQFYVPGRYVDETSGILELIRFCLKNNKYLSLHLNEKNVPGKWAYERKDFEHRSLVYGIDDEERQLYLMGYNKTQTFEPYTLSYDDFCLAYKNVRENKELVILAYQIPEVPFTLNKERIIDFLSEYLSGTNSTYRDSLIYDEIDWVFGVNIYDTLADNAEKLRDKKITYLVSEHKKLMKERIRYLFDCNVLEKKEFDELDEMAVNIEEMSQLLLLLCIKFKMTSKEKYIEMIRNHLSEMKKADMDFITKFIEYMKSGQVEK